MAKRKPKNKVEVTLCFDSKDQAEIFIASWLDGGGADSTMSSAYTDSWGKDWVYMKTSENACPDCGYLSPYFYNVERKAGTPYQCDNCPCTYVLK